MAVININRNQFEEMVHSGKTVLVEFSAPWCVSVSYTHLTLPTILLV